MSLLDDPSQTSSAQPLKVLLANFNQGIEAVYADLGIKSVPPRFSMALIRLHHLGPLTIKDLAREVEVTHSAMSQTITAMTRAGLTERTVGPDARTKVVSLSAEGRRIVPLLEAEWVATEKAFVELNAEVPYALTQVVTDMTAALGRRSFRDRINAHLVLPAPAPGPDSGTDSDPDTDLDPDSNPEQ